MMVAEAVERVAVTSRDERPDVGDRRHFLVENAIAQLLGALDFLGRTGEANLEIAEPAERRRRSGRSVAGTAACPRQDAVASGVDRPSLLPCGQPNRPLPISCPSRARRQEPHGSRHAAVKIARFSRRNKRFSAARTGESQFPDSTVTGALRRRDRPGRGAANRARSASPAPRRCRRRRLRRGFRRGHRR